MKSENDLKIVFFGTLGRPRLSMEILKDLIEKKFPIQAVIVAKEKTSPKENSSRKNLQELLFKKGIELKEITRVDSEIINFLKKSNSNLFIVVAFGKILPSSILEIPNFQTINVHPSLLPKFRGPSPIKTALLEGEKQTGVSFMLLNEKMDQGDLLSSEKIEIDSKDLESDLEDKIIEKTEKVFPAIINDWIEGKIDPKKQDHSLATYTKIIDKSDGKIDWLQSNLEIFNRYRAFHFWPKIFSFWNGKKIIFEKISLSDFQPNFDQNLKIGQVFELKNDFLVKCQTGAIKIEKIQLEGKKTLPIDEFVRGQRNFVNSILS